MALHWLIAALILSNIVLGWNTHAALAETRRMVVPLHQSIGLTVLMLSVLRLAWRLTHKPPPLGAHLALWESRLAHAVHALLYAVMILLPLSGWVLASSRSPPMALHWWGIAFPYATFLPPDGQRTTLTAAVVAHRWLGYTLYALFIGHIGGALKHQFVDRDGELARVIPFLRPSGGE